MLDAHNLSVRVACDNFQAGGQGSAVKNQRMVAGRPDLFRQAAEQRTFRVKQDRAGLAMHQMCGRNGFSTERLSYRLVAEAHPQNGNLAAQPPYSFHGNTCISGVAGPRRDQQGLRFYRLDFFRCDFVASHDADVRVKHPYTLAEVIGKAVVIIQKENHSSAAFRIASSTARALFSVSRHSFSGTLSATIPAPACT